MRNTRLRIWPFSRFTNVPLLNDILIIFSEENIIMPLQKKKYLHWSFNVFTKITLAKILKLKFFKEENNCRSTYMYLLHIVTPQYYLKKKIFMPHHYGAINIFHHGTCKCVGLPEKKIDMPFPVIACFLCQKFSHSW